MLSGVEGGQVAPADRVGWWSAEGEDCGGRGWWKGSAGGSE